MYAIVKTGGKQYRVSQGDTLKVEKIEQAAGDTLQLDQVLLVADQDTVHVGKPVLSGAVVHAEVVEHGRHKKVHIVKFKRRKHHLKRMGHRQWFTELKITNITL